MTTSIFSPSSHSYRVDIGHSLFSRVILLFIFILLFILRIFRFQDLPFFRLFSSSRVVAHDLYWLKEYQSCPKIQAFNYEYKITACEQFSAGKVVRVIGSIDQQSANKFFEKKELIVSSIFEQEFNLFSPSHFRAYFSGQLLRLQHFLKTQFYSSQIQIINAYSAELLSTMLWGNDSLSDSPSQFFTNSITRELKDIMRLSGLSHLLSVSGFHLGLLFGLISALIRRFWVFHGHPSTRGGESIFVILLLGLYSLVIGSSASVLRAYGMTVFSLINRTFFYRSPKKIFILISAVIVMLFYNPFYLGEVGWQLSVLATLALIITPKFSLKQKPKVISFIIENLLITLFVQLFTLPVIWIYFNEFQPATFLTNLIFVPISASVLQISLIFWLLNAFRGFFQIINFIFTLYGQLFGLFMDLFIQGLQFFASLELPRILPEFSWGFIQLFCYYFSLFSLIYFLNRRLLKTKLTFIP